MKTQHQIFVISSLKTNKLFKMMILASVAFIPLACSSKSNSECKSLEEISKMSKNEDMKAISEMSEECFNSLCMERFKQIMSLEWSQEELQHWETLIKTLDGKMHILYGNPEDTETQRYGKLYDAWAKEGAEKFGWNSVMTDYFIKAPFRFTFTQQVLNDLRQGKEVSFDQQNKTESANSSMTRSQWLQLSENERISAYASMNGEAKYAFWIDKLSQVKELSWSKAELSHIVDLENFLKENKKVLFLDNDKEKSTELMSSFANKWQQEAISKFKWSKELATKILSDGNNLTQEELNTLKK